MLIDIHCHSSQHSDCSVISAEELVKKAVAKHLQGIAITDHHYLWSEKEIEELRGRTEVGEGFLIFAGQEVSTDFGHVVVFGALETIGEKEKLEFLKRKFPSAAFILAHPFRNGRIPQKEVLLSPLIDAVEIFSMNQTTSENFMGLKFYHKYKFVAVSASDAHSYEMAAMFPTQFDHPVRNVAELAEEIKRARVRPFYKEIPKSGTNASVLEITIGTKGDDEKRNRIIVRNPVRKRWKSELRTAELLRKISDGGFSEGAFRVPKIVEIDRRDGLIIEEGMRGKRMFDVLKNSGVSQMKKIFLMAAEWLAKFHSTDVGFSASPEKVIEKECGKLVRYRERFASSGNPLRGEAEVLAEFIARKEEEISKKNFGKFVLNHGDFHPKNIIVGFDRSHDPDTVFLSAIDFGSVIFFDRAFDVGYFLAQYKNQFREFPRVLDVLDDGDFLARYIEKSRLADEPDFAERVKVFEIRGNLSIASAFVKFGKGESPEMGELIAQSMGLKDTITA